MKLLQIIHDFLPYHVAGAEVYTYSLAKELQGRGHDVHLLFTEIRHDRPQYEVTTGDYDGIPYHEVVWNFQRENFELSYLNPRMDRIVEQVLDELRPDIVHLQHFLFFGLGMIDLAKARDIPVVFTLHEYCLTCCRWGLRMTEELELCHDLVAEKCAVCISDESVAGPAAASPARAPLVQRLLGKGVHRYVRDSLAYLRLAPRRRSMPRDPAGRRRESEDHRRAIERRWSVVRERLDRVDLFIAPSPFLRRKFVEFGIAEDRIVFSDYGFRVEEHVDVPKVPAEKLRFGYLGTLVEHKGVRTLVQAMNRVDPTRAELRIHGDLTFFPDFARRLEATAASAGIRFMGRFDNRDVANILASIDVLIVPSIWFENSPLTIHEAFMSKVPVVTTDLGGMRDLVEDGVSGLLFERGNAVDLAAKLNSLVDDPGLVRRLAANIPDVKPIAQDAAEMERRYERLLGRGGLAASKTAGIVD